jgi:hypothetical protein
MNTTATYIETCLAELGITASALDYLLLIQLNLSDEIKGKNNNLSSPRWAVTFYLSVLVSRNISMLIGAPGLSMDIAMAAAHLCYKVRQQEKMGTSDTSLLLLIERLLRYVANHPGLCFNNGSGRSGSRGTWTEYNDPHKVTHESN